MPSLSIGHKSYYLQKKTASMLKQGIEAVNASEIISRHPAGAELPGRSQQPLHQIRQPTA